MATLNWKVVTSTLGLFGAVSFVLCIVYGLAVPRAWHPTQLLELALPGFTWLTPTSFVLGLVESVIYGVYVGLVFTLIYNFVAKRARTGGAPGGGR